MASEMDTGRVFEGDETIDRILDDSEALAGDAEDLGDLEEAGYEPEDGETDVAAVGGAAAKSSKRFYNIVSVIGAPMPSENARYGGSSPSVAAKKAARKIWDKSGKKAFTVIMRKVSQQVAGRTLYKYEMKIVKLADPVGFISVTVPSFKDTSGKKHTNVNKRVKIVSSSKDPVFGYIDASGTVIEGSKDESGFGTLHRSPKNNTLTFNIGGKPMPKKIGTITVSRTDWHPEFKRLTPTDSEREKFDVAGAQKEKAKAAKKTKTKKASKK